MKVPFSPPFIDESVIDEVVDALRSGWITTGPRTKKLEANISAYCGVPQVLCVNSATAGMELVLRWLGVGPGDEVILPAYTYCATANVVMHCGATPVLADMHPDDFCIDIEHVAHLITDKTKVILPVDLGGMPIDYRGLKALINSEDKKSLFNPNNAIQETLGRIFILTDGAHSLGAEYDERPATQQADVTVFSFHAVKNLTTAEGGAICFNLPAPIDNALLYKTFNTLSLHGQSKDALAKFGSGGWEYDVETPGYKCNMPDILGAIGLKQLEKYEDILNKRKYIIQKYLVGLAPFSWAQLPIFSDNNRVSSYHLFLLRIKGISIDTRNQIIEDIGQKGVSVNVHYKPLPLLTAYNNHSTQAIPQALDAFHREISLPVFYDITDEQIQYVIDVVTQAVAQNINKNNLQSQANEG